MSPHGQFLDLFIEEVLLGWRGRQLFWIHGSWVQEISWSSSLGQFHGLLMRLPVYFSPLLAHHLGRTNLCQSGLVQIFGGCIDECQEKLLEQSYTHLSSVWPWSMRSCRKSLHIVHSIECLHVMRLVEGHIRTNRLRVDMESVHPFINLSNDFRWRGTLAWIWCQL